MDVLKAGRWHGDGTLKARRKGYQRRRNRAERGGKEKPIHLHLPHPIEKTTPWSMTNWDRITGVTAGWFVDLRLGDNHGRKWKVEPDFPVVERGWRGRVSETRE